MAFTNWKHCARLLPDDEFTHFFLVNYRDLPPGTYSIWRYNPVLNGGLPEEYLGPFTITGGRFPYGYLVEADSL